MAFFPIHRYRLLDDPVNRFFGDQLDFFDPWHDFETFPSALSIRPNTFRWINPPQRIVQPANHIPYRRKSLQPIPTRIGNFEKFRVQLNVIGFNPESIQTRIDGSKLLVEAKEENHSNNDHCTIRHVQKTYDLPEYADTNHFTSYVTPNNILVIEVPIHDPDIEYRLSQARNENPSLSQFGQYYDPSFDYVGFLSGSDFHPHVVEKGENQKQLEMFVEMKDYQPEEIKVFVKNNELIVQGEHKYEDHQRSERSFFFKSTTLPPGTQVDRLKSQLTNDRHLKIEAPFIEQQEPGKAIESQQN